MADFKAKAIPKFGLKLKLNHVYPETRSADYTPIFRVILGILPLIIRYLWYYIKAKCTGGSVVMDFLKVQNPKPIYGVPIGGIGCGSIGRGYKGEFCRFQLQPGIYEWNTVDANQFIVTIKDGASATILHSLLSTFPKKTLKSWESLIEGSQCSYTGLYPRSWTEYDLSEYGVKLVCRQISPVIPHDYNNSALPCTVFVWSIENVSKEERHVTIAFTFKNGTANKHKTKQTCSSSLFSSENCSGVLLNHTIGNQQCTFALGTSNPITPNKSISRCLYFDPNCNGLEFWNELKKAGELRASNSSFGPIDKELGCAVACRFKVAPNCTEMNEMYLVWHMPSITFPKKRKEYSRYYTKLFNGENAAVDIVEYAFKEYSNWESKIFEWQNPILSDSFLPDWYKSALFNETYYISDGGAVWVNTTKEESKNYSKTDPRSTIGRFIYLEGHEYKMFNSYDVHFYASHALHYNWPLLQRSLQYDLKDTVFMEIPTKMKMLYDGKIVERKVINTVPHDNGDPGEEPFILINGYPIHDVSEWRDLNSKFVLQVFRDALVTESGKFDKDFVSDMYEACKVVMEKNKTYDVDGDGLIENSGMPDQTFDTWVMVGASAYCGGLWLAALYAMKRMADLMEKPDDEAEFAVLLEKGKIAYEKKLWNGSYYNFDCSQDEKHSIMADQLCAQWYLRCIGIDDYAVFPKDRVVKALNTIYKNNVEGFCNGKMGAVNGIIHNKVDPFTVQSVEVWTGVTYALAANLIYEDLIAEGFQTAGGMYKSMVERFGLAFQTPEALYEEKYVRSIGYMRPLSIWSMQIALDERNKKKIDVL